jgi:hypothetical protein
LHIAFPQNVALLRERILGQVELTVAVDVEDHYLVITTVDAAISEQREGNLAISELRSASPHRLVGLPHAERRLALRLGSADLEHEYGRGRCTGIEATLAGRRLEDDRGRAVVGDEVTRTFLLEVAVAVEVDKQAVA